MEIVQTISFSGVHGAGKSTIIGELANHILKEEKLVPYVFREMGYRPYVLKPATEEFQVFYNREMLIREGAIVSVHQRGIPDFILMDRIALDVKIYTAMTGILEGHITWYTAVKELSYDLLYYLRNTPLKPMTCNVVVAKSEDITKRNAERLNDEENKSRKNWKDTEQNLEYVHQLNDLFYNIWKQLMEVPELREADYTINIIENNKPLDEVVKAITQEMFADEEDPSKSL